MERQVLSDFKRGHVPTKQQTKHPNKQPFGIVIKDGDTFSLHLFISVSHFCVPAKNRNK